MATLKHGVYVEQRATAVNTPFAAASGVPFVIGAAPVQSAEKPVGVGVPMLVSNWEDAVKLLGYSEDWESYPLCEFMYSHFRLFACEPVVFCNVLDPGTMKETVEGKDLAVTDHKVVLPLEAINDAALVVKQQGGQEAAYVRGTDYETYYSDQGLVVELLEDGSHYAETQLNIAYDQVKASQVTSTVIATGLEKVDLCATSLKVVPDLLCAPGHSHDPAVAAIMAEKAAGIGGLFRAKALIDQDTTKVKTLAQSITAKETDLTNAVEQDVCWPLLRYEGRTYHQSTQLAGVMAQTDTKNDGTPCESPSNKRYMCDAAVLADGTEITLTLDEANKLNANGIVTALKFLGEWTCWGNYNACWPENTDVKDYFIPVSRMFGWVGNSVTKTIWTRVDNPMNRPLIDAVMNDITIWLNGLTGSGYLLGGRIEFLDEENPTENLIAGIMKFHIYLTPPSPAQEIDFILEYDASYVASALQG